MSSSFPHVPLPSLCYKESNKSYFIHADVSSPLALHVTGTDYIIKLWDIKNETKLGHLFQTQDFMRTSFPGFNSTMAVDWRNTTHDGFVSENGLKSISEALANNKSPPLPPVLSVWLRDRKTAETSFEGCLVTCPVGSGTLELRPALTKAALEGKQGYSGQALFAAVIKWAELSGHTGVIVNTSNVSEPLRLALQSSGLNDISGNICDPSEGENRYGITFKSKTKPITLAVPSGPLHASGC